MEISEFIGFIIAFTLLAFSFLKRMYEEWRRKADPEQYRKEQEEQDNLLREFLQSLDIDVEEQPKPKRQVGKKSSLPTRKKRPIVKKRVKQTTHRNLGDDFEFHSNLDNYSKKNVIESRQFETNIVDKFGDGYGDRLVSRELRAAKPMRPYTQKEELKLSRAKALIKGLDSKKDMVILKEIFGPPKSMQ